MPGNTRERKWEKSPEGNRANIWRRETKKGRERQREEERGQEKRREAERKGERPREDKKKRRDEARREEAEREGEKRDGEKKRYIQMKENKKISGKSHFKSSRGKKTMN